MAALNSLSLSSITVSTAPVAITRLVRRPVILSTKYLVIIK